jgi:hypothetical protein
MKSKHVLLALAIIASLSLLACGSAGIGSFDVTEESSEAVITGGGGSPLGDLLPVNNLFPPMTLMINLEEELEEQNAEGAKAIFLQDLEMVITDTEQPEGDTDNFDFVDEVNVFVESTKSGTTLEKKQIATLKDVPEGQTSVSFTTEKDVNLKPYVEEGMKLTTAGSGEVPEDDTSLKAIVTLTIQVL